MWESFKDQLVRIRDQHVPVMMKDRNGRVQEPWMTGDVECLVKKNKEAYVKCRKLKSDNAFEEYK